MTEPHTTRQWISYLHDATASLRRMPTMAGAYEALAGAWHTAATVAVASDPATELGWMRLAEAITGARDQLTTIDPAAGHAVLNPTAQPPAGPAPDVPALRAAVVELVEATIAALRRIAADTEQLDTAYAIIHAAATLHPAQEWP